eukprot:g74013.t1
MDYIVKTIWFFDRSSGQYKEICIVLQSVNGPCPLIAVCNVLLLRGKIVIPTDRTKISFEELCDLLKKFLEQKLQSVILKPRPDRSQQQQEAIVANVICSFEDTVQMLPVLEAGLDVNCVFTHPTKFEFTPQIALFDMFETRLLHGWVCDPQDKVLQKAIESLSYNEVVNLLTTDDTPMHSPAEASYVPHSLSPSSTPEKKQNQQSGHSALANMSAVSAAGLAGMDTMSEANSSAVASSASSFAATPVPTQPALQDSPPAAEVGPDSPLAPFTSSSAPAPGGTASTAAAPAATPAGPAGPRTSPTPGPDLPSGAATPPEAKNYRTDAPELFAPLPIPGEGESKEVREGKRSMPVQIHTAAQGSPVRESKRGSSANRIRREVLRNWLASSQSQLTVVGLSELHSVVKEGELTVFFRNNHFSVLHKFQGELYCLVTDSGLLGAAPYIVWNRLADVSVWNRLADVSGDDEFLDYDFRVPDPTRSSQPPVRPAAGGSAGPGPGPGTALPAGPYQGLPGNRPGANRPSAGPAANPGYPAVPVAAPVAGPAGPGPTGPVVPAGTTMGEPLPIQKQELDNKGVIGTVVDVSSIPPEADEKDDETLARELQEQENQAERVRQARLARANLEYKQQQLKAAQAQAQANAARRANENGGIGVKMHTQKWAGWVLVIVPTFPGKLRPNDNKQIGEDLVADHHRLLDLLLMKTVNVRFFEQHNLGYIPCESDHSIIQNIINKTISGENARITLLREDDQNLR